MHLRTRLLLGFGAVLATAAIGLGLSLGSARELASASRGMVDSSFAAMDVASDLRRVIATQQLPLTERLSQPGADASDLLAPFEQQVRDLLQRARRPRQSVLEVEQLQRAESALLALRGAVDAAALADQSGGQVPLAVIEAFVELRDAAFALYRLNHASMVRRGKSISTQAQRLSLALGLLAGFTVLIGVLASLRLAQRLSEPMERLARAAKRVSQQDFEVRVASSGVQEVDSVARSFNEMTAALRRFHAINLDRLVDERRRLDAVIADIDDGLVLFDENGRIERLNPVAGLQLGLDPDVALWRTLEHLDVLPDLATAVRTLLRDPGAALPGKPEITVGEGADERTLAYSLLPFSESQRRGLILVLRDITDARRFEQLRTQFVLRASHELRTPITSMRMALGLLSSRPLFPEGSREADLFATLDEQMQRMMSLNERLLDLSRLYSGNAPLERGTVDPTELLQSARSRFELAAREAGVTLTVSMPDELPELSIDRNAIDRVLDNLISNAIRHTPAGGSVELGASRRGGELDICVSDTGDGIPPTDQSRVFEPFVQVGRKAGGSGLGLAISREIVEQHGGRIRLSSVPGSGTTFRIGLPLG